MLKPQIDPSEILAAAQTLGFDDVGVCRAKIPEPDLNAWQHWLDKGLHAELHYMSQAARYDPSNLLPEAKSAIVFITNYKQPKMPFKSDHGLVASYARGRDYHNLHRKRLKAFIKWLDERTEHRYKSRGFSDSAPLLEKALAVQAGLGWFGKNTLLIHRKFGTFTLLSVVLTTLELSYYSGIDLRTARCGSCRLCLDHCPTQALSDYTLDARLCLSYHTIESKHPIPPEIASKNKGYLFGCDICQEVCPHNVRSPLAKEEAFSPNKGQGVYLSKQQIEDLQKESLFGSPLNRKGKEGLLATFKQLESL